MASFPLSVFFVVVVLFVFPIPASDGEPQVQQMITKLW
jgi:hypothetical protein